MTTTAVAIAPPLEAFFTQRLLRDRQASSYTIAAYRDSFRLLLAFAQQRLGKPPSALVLGDLDAPFIGLFLQDLERTRRNTARTRNLRLAAIHSFFRYLAVQEPTHSALIQRVLAIPSKRCERKPIDFLTREEMDALLAAPDRDTWIGRRDHALLLLALQTGLRVSELVSLRRQDVALDGQYQRNVGEASSWQNVTDTALANVNDAVLRARDLVIQGANDTVGPEGRQGMAWPRSCSFLPHSRKLSRAPDWAGPRRRSNRGGLSRKQDSTPCPYPHRANWPAHSTRRCSRSSPFRRPS